MRSASAASASSAISRDDLADIVLHPHADRARGACASAWSAAAATGKAEIVAALHRLRRYVIGQSDAASAKARPQFDALHKGFHVALIAACGSPRMLAAHSEPLRSGLPLPPADDGGIRRTRGLFVERNTSSSPSWRSSRQRAEAAVALGAPHRDRRSPMSIRQPRDGRGVVTNAADRIPRRRSRLRRSPRARTAFVRDPRGEIVCVVGPSGCGKTTALRVAAGLIAPTRGEVAFAGAPVRGPRRDVAIVFQDYAQGAAAVAHRRRQRFARAGGDGHAARRARRRASRRC